MVIIMVGVGVRDGVVEDGDDGRGDGGGDGCWVGGGVSDGGDDDGGDGDSGDDDGDGGDDGLTNFVCSSWLHLFGKSKKQSYKVSRRKKPSSSNPGRTQQYRQTRYRHIAESRNSAVIPTRIAKRSSTASTYNVSQLSSTANLYSSTQSGQYDTNEKVDVASQSI